MHGVWYIYVVYVLLVGCLMSGVEGLGVNWGSIATHPLPPKVVVQMLKDNGIQKVKLFDTEQSVLKALGGSGIEVMVTIPNGELAAMNIYDRAKEWVRGNITNRDYNGGANITYVAIGNEPFLKSYNGSLVNVTFPALKNIQTALDEAGAGNFTKATIPFNADVYDSPKDNPVPSSGRFRADISSEMTKIVKFLDQSKSPFFVNIYPFLSLYYGNDTFPVDYAFFDGGSVPVVDNGVLYTNVFDANYDTLVAALNDVGYGNMTIMVGEIGWPTDGNKFANVTYASRFYNGILTKLLANKGTPLRSGYIEVYLFGLLDEDAKSVLPGDFERHWGIFTYDGRAKYPLDLSGKNKSVVPAQGVKYQPKKWCQLNPKAKDLSKLEDHVKTACDSADCTSLGFGSSCNGLDAAGNASYAFNAYYQVHNQEESSCNFDGLAMVTTQNVSQGNCNFTIQLVPPPPPPLPPSERTEVASAGSSPLVPLTILGLIAFLVL